MGIQKDNVNYTLKDYAYDVVSRLLNGAAVSTRYKLEDMLEKLEIQLIDKKGNYRSLEDIINNLSDLIEKEW